MLWYDYYFLDYLGCTYSCGPSFSLGQAYTQLSLGWFVFMPCKYILILLCFIFKMQANILTKSCKVNFILFSTEFIFCMYLWGKTFVRFIKLDISSVQSLSRVRLFATPWITACQASLSITNSRSSLRLTSIESVMPSSHLILCRPLLLSPQSLPASESFPLSQLFTWGGQSTGVSALASFPPKKSQGWSPLGWTGWISLQSKGLSRVFSNTTVQKYQFFGAQLSSQSNSHIHTWPLEKP